MAIDTTDVRTYGDEQVLKVADYLALSEDRQQVFGEIYRGKNNGKTAKEIATNLNALYPNRNITSKRVLEITLAFKGKKFIQVNRAKGELTFAKVDFFAVYKQKILRLAKDKNARDRFRAEIYGYTANKVTVQKANIQRHVPKVVTKQVKARVATKVNETWDVFISHASEDKASIARPLRDALAQAGLKVWFDESELKVGDHLHKSIDEGIAKSGYGIVILSENFFAKDWPLRELEGLVAKEYQGRRVILPLWHNVDAAFIRSKSLLLAGILGIPTSKGIPYIVQEVLKVVKPGGQEQTTVRPPIVVAKGEESRRSILEGTITSLQVIDEATIVQTIKDMDLQVLQKTFNDLLEAIAVLDIDGDAPENKNIFRFLKEAVLGRNRTEGAIIFEALLNWYFETTTPMCKEEILKTFAVLLRSPDLKAVAIKRKGEFIGEFGRSRSYDIAGINAEIILNLKSSLSSNDCTRIVDFSISNNQINGSTSASSILLKILPSFENKVDPKKIERLYKLIT